MAVSAQDFKAAMASFAASVTVVTTIDAARKPWGITVTAFASLSLEPPLCLVCLDRRAASLEAIRTSRKLAVNMLAAEQQELSGRFASKRDDKFAGVGWRAGPVTGAPLIEGTLATLECRVVDFLAGGDHEIVVAEVDAVETQGGLPLVYWRGRYADVTAR